MSATSTVPPPRAPPAPRAGGCSPGAQPETAGAPTGLQPGSGRLRVEQVDGESSAVGCVSTSPLRLLLPRPRGRTVWAVAASHGGGLVGGDVVSLDLQVGPGAQACLTTQAETKVYRSTGPAGRQTLRAAVSTGGLLAILPEPVSAYRGSAYQQAQRFDLDPGASLVLLDAVVSGRAARGERWAFRAVETAIEVRIGDRLLLADALRLAADEGPPVAARMGGLELLATVVLVGPRLAGAARALLDDLQARPAAPGPVLAAASPLGDGLHLRLGASDVEAGLAALRAHLAFLPALLGEDPLSRRP